jgi:branched-chain amino acid transport system substrate-binding protein
MARLSRGLSRRSFIASASVAGALAGTRFMAAAGAEAAPIRLGLEAHLTGIGAAYGHWYDKVSKAAVKTINDAGGIAGRPVELIVEDDATDAKRASEVIEKFANQHKVDFVFGPLFSNVAASAAARAGELKMPLIVCSETSELAAGKFNRYVFQTANTNVRSQVKAISPWFAANVGKKVCMFVPDYVFGYEHRDVFSEAIKASGGEVKAVIAISPMESSFTKYFSQIPSDADAIYHVMVGPGVLTFVRELGEFFGGKGPNLFGFIDSLEAVDIASPGLEFLEGSHLWEGFPRYASGLNTDYAKAYRKAVGIDDNGADVANPGDISTASHMFGCWESVYAIKQIVEASGYKDGNDRPKFIEALEAVTSLPESDAYPQGTKTFVGKCHQSFGRQFISQVKGGKLEVVHTTSIDDGMYDVEGDYSKQAL